MDMFIFSVFDSAAARFAEPFFAPSIEFAIRGFRQAVNREGSQIGQFPEDYTLYEIGQFDAESGRIIPCDPRSLGIAVTFVERIQPVEVSDG